MNKRPERYHYAIDNTQNTSVITVDIRQRGPTTCNIACLRIVAKIPEGNFVSGERPLFLLTAVQTALEGGVGERRKVNAWRLRKQYINLRLYQNSNTL